VDTAGPIEVDMVEMPGIVTARGVHPAGRSRWILAAACLVAGSACLAARWLPGGLAVRTAYGLLVAGVLLVIAVRTRRTSTSRFNGLALAFFVFALVQVLNNSVPVYVGSSLLHQPPVPGNPLASTASGTVVIQLLETALAAVPILVLTKAAGQDLSTIYVRKGTIGRGLVIAAAVFMLCYLAAATGLSDRLFPVLRPLPLHQILALTPALLLLSLSNGFQEELLFRGLFLRRYLTVFGKHTANLLQAAIFTVAHAGVTYTPAALIFLVVFVFPLGLITGYLMRTTRGILAPVILHAGTDIPIYLAFLSYVSSP
jgi:membrane protease YdiL (CAAX protease family)